MHNFRKLKIQQPSGEKIKEINKIGQEMPAEEIYSLTSQIRRAAVSMPANSAEGCGRDSDKEIIRYLNIASGSAAELETLLFPAENSSYLSNEKSGDVINEVIDISREVKIVKTEEHLI